MSDEELERYRTNIMDLDQYLAPYPYESYKTWFSLTDHIRPFVVNKLQPLNNKITSQSELVSKEFENFGEAGQRVDKNHPVRTRYFDEQVIKLRQKLTFYFYFIKLSF